MGPGFRQDDTEGDAVFSRLTRFRRRLAQAVPAQAILALHRHRQPRGFLRAPAIAREVAAEFSAAACAGEAARFRRRGCFRICHDPRKGFAVIFMSGSSVAAVYYALRTDSQSGWQRAKEDRWPAIRKPPWSRSTVSASGPAAAHRAT